MCPRRRVETTNPELLSLIRYLRKKSREHKAAIWRRVSEMLLKSKRRRIAVNISRISRYTEENDEVIVPGKVLGSGTISHPVKVAAFAFSEKARSKILKARGECLTIPELAEMNPKGSNVKIIG